MDDVQKGGDGWIKVTLAAGRKYTLLVSPETLPLATALPGTPLPATLAFPPWIKLSD